MGDFLKMKQKADSIFSVSKKYKKNLSAHLRNRQKQIL